jgi:arginase family enzyme
MLSVFGASLDPWDAEDRINLKHVYMAASSIGRAKDAFLCVFRDPYDGFLQHTNSASIGKIEKLGKIPVDSWLTPTPEPFDQPLVNVPNYAVFIDSDGCRQYADKVKMFVQNQVKDNLPLMIGVDHSLTGGAIEALAEKLGRENLSVIILDSHSDFIPMEIRYNALQQYREKIKWTPDPNYFDPFGDKRPETYNVGSFLYHLIKDETILPEKVAFIGVSDKPPKSVKVQDKRISDFLNFYHGIEAQGMQIISKKDIVTKGVKKALKPIKKLLNSKYVYISVDIDVGANAAVFGARIYKQPPIVGLSASQLYKIAKVLSKLIIKQKRKLAGLDIMETDVYTAGMPMENGGTDRTYQVEANMLRHILKAY